ncbi:DNA-binding CsgD family transcriptional regulator [Labrenzia sp. EL_208]|nr:DNA-binding CsgD family transcriptional regulator [Labrenzia sp. EL_132]MBG6228900.1 DNA-binding CsgD family transcriptional regulator [Labrenzia sp. EL_208]
MLTTLSGRETNLLFAIMEDMVAIRDARKLRTQIGERLLDLLEADYFASYVWTKSDGDTGGVYLNMDESNLAAYESHYQYCDPITPRFRMCQRAAHVEQVISREQFDRTEFYNDFLARDGLYHGMNYHAYSASGHLGDLRIWRSGNRETFQERDVICLLAEGRRDREIATVLGVSVTTVRSHLKSIFQKSGASSRANLIVSLNAPVQ